MDNLARQRTGETAGDVDSSGVGVTRGKTVRLPLISTYLEEQQRLSAVERFAQHHERNSPPAQARYYEDLIPSAKPGSGQQYGFSVDLDRCTGCKACVTACNSLNGLDDGEVWRSVGFVHGGTAEAPFQQTVTTACHHCVDPGCMKGCPVGAYEKDPITGIVKHLDDQCIGCQYCTLTCPYEVPQYSQRLGIVRKCDMCSDRLEAGEAPACVQACPSEAISIRLVDTADAVARSQGVLVPESPASSLTIPTTEYTTRRTLPINVVPADFDDLRPSTPHTPLAIMLVLSQASAGAFLVSTLLGGQSGFEANRQVLALLALGFGVVGLVSSPMHLGRPQFGFRAILGVRTSWLSREILAFGAFAPVAGIYTASLFAGPLGRLLGLPRVNGELLRSAQDLLGVTTVVAAFGVVACSMMVYAVTGRTYWSIPRTFVRFFSSAAVSGLAMALAVAASLEGAGTLVIPLALALALATTFKLSHEAAIFRKLAPGSPADLQRTAKIMLGPLEKWTLARGAAGVAGGVLLPLSVVLLGAFTEAPAGPASMALALLGWALVLAGEYLERELFFRAASAPRMPGGVAR
jgi:Fe-S-cluster-containing dehydrogenase component/DMSO reductase anchor subunit